MPFRRDSDHRPPRGTQRRSRPSIREKRLAPVPDPSPEEGRGDRPPRAERDRQDDRGRHPVGRDRPEPRPLPSEEAALGRRPRVLQGDGGPRLPREDRAQRAHDRYQAPVRHKLSKVYSGKVRDLLRKIDHQGKLAELTTSLELGSFLDRDIGQLSGGELQRLAIAATMLKDADVYFFDEPSSYLDIYQRLKVAKVIQSLSKEKYVVVVEHDLAVLDFLADTVFLMYGEEGAYGIIAQPRPVRTAINVYLGGYLKEENIRFRDREIGFDTRPPRGDWKAETLVTFGELTKRFEDFELAVHPGRLRKGEVVGVVGPNATGKTTFVKMLVGQETPTSGAVEGQWQVS